MKNCQARRTRSAILPRPCGATGAAVSSRVSASTGASSGAASAWAISAVRSSTSRLPDAGHAEFILSRGGRLVSPRGGGGRAGRACGRARGGAASAAGQRVLRFLEAIADAIQGFDHIELDVACLELLAQPLDMA